MKNLKLIIFDAPCGDFNWMKLVLNKCDINYIGGDIVENLINDLNKQFSSSKRLFINIDITQDKLPDADLMMVRDCLFTSVMRTYFHS